MKDVRDFCRNLFSPLVHRFPWVYNWQELFEDFKHTNLYAHGEGGFVRYIISFVRPDKPHILDDLPRKRQ